MKKVLAIILTMVLVLSLAACGGGEKKDDTKSNEETKTVVTEAPVSDMELCAEYAVGKLKDILKNPSSLVVNELLGVKDDGDYIFGIDYSAENGFGGSNRDHFFISVSKNANSFSVNSLGSSDYASAENQRLTKQLFAQKPSSDYIEFNTTTYRFSK